MKISVDWLRQYVEVDSDISKVSDVLTMIGIEVEARHSLFPTIPGIVVGRILDIEPHPKADRLVVCQVDIGKSNPSQIVCGAKNMRTGDFVPVAVPGTDLGGGFVIKEAKLRGVASCGMLCSEAELGLPIESGGLWILPSDLPVGAPLPEAGLAPDWQLELEITPNRPDCLSLIGIAREYAAVTGQTVGLPAIEFQEDGPSAADLVSVDIDAPDRCARYVARVLRGVSIGPSPQWMAWRLLCSGMRPISSIVDVTNYVLLETGHPLHAFDMRNVEDHAIIVRCASEGEQFQTLDEKVHQLKSTDLVIADGRRAVALAGIMGGLNSEIADDTSDVLLESAWFEPSGVRATARRLGIATESSHRFSRGTDLEGLEWASRRAIALFQELAGGTVAPGSVDAYPRPYQPHTVRCRTHKAEGLLGVELSTEKIADYLGRLELPLEIVDDGAAVEVTVPSFRHDLEIEADLIEEIGRLHGLDAISEIPGKASVGYDPGDELDQFSRRIRHYLADRGWTETVSYSLISRGDDHLWGGGLAPAGADPVAMANPLASDQEVLRRSLLPSLLSVVATNLSHGNKDLCLMEMDRVFWRDEEGEPQECNRLGLIMTGAVFPNAWSHPQRELVFGFYDLKAAIEELFHALDIQRSAGLLECRRAADGLPAPLDAQYAAEWVDRSGRRVAVAGCLESKRVKKLRSAHPIWMAEIDIDWLLSVVPAVRPYQPLPHYPAVTRDIALVLDRDREHREVMAVFEKQAEPLLEAVSAFDLYVGDKLPEGKKSLAYSLTYRSSDKTLTDEEVNDVHQRMVQHLCSALDAELRG
jgi:phenylalanyl-tRNA synthetase beta chain